MPTTLKLPPHTTIKDSYGLAFSEWDGYLALVNVATGAQAYSIDSAWFDVEKMQRRYAVRYALDGVGRRFPVPAGETARERFYWLGMQPRFLNPNLPYEGNHFTVGSSSNHTAIGGTFGPIEDFWLTLKLGELGEGEAKVVARYWSQQPGYFDATDSGIIAGYWAKLLKQASLPDALSSIPVDKANKIDRWLNNRPHHADTDEKQAAAWNGIAAVYFLRRDGTPKAIVLRKPAQAALPPVRALGFGRKAAADSPKGEMLLPKRRKRGKVFESERDYVDEMWRLRRSYDSAWERITRGDYRDRDKAMERANKIDERIKVLAAEVEARFPPRPYSSAAAEAGLGVPPAAAQPGPARARERWVLWRSDEFKGDDELLGDDYPSRDAAIEAAVADGGSPYRVYAMAGNEMILGTQEKLWLKPKPKTARKVAVGAAAAQKPQKRKRRKGVAPPSGPALTTQQRHHFIEAMRKHAIKGWDFHTAFLHAEREVGVRRYGGTVTIDESEREQFRPAYDEGVREYERQEREHEAREVAANERRRKAAAAVLAVPPIAGARPALPAMGETLLLFALNGNGPRRRKKKR